MKSVVVMSGGLDSTTLLYDVVSSSSVGEVTAISFDYGQRHSKELDCARAITNKLNVEHLIVDMSFLGKLYAIVGSESSLISPTEVPEGHYAEENMKSTVVPNRNMIFASVAAGMAISMNADALFLGVHAGDHFVYPDCRPRFFNALNASIVLGNEGFGPIGEHQEGLWTQEYVMTPYINLSKNEIAQLAFDLDVPIEMTWSCYKGSEYHCGRCGTCVERREAIESTGNPDPTDYIDRDYWKSVVKTNA